jgi:molybdopterin converting factor small subunit
MDEVPTIEIPSRYRVPIKGQATMQVEGRTVRECIAAIEAENPGFQELIFDPRGDLNRFVTLCKNGETMARDALDEALAPDDRITIMAAMAGG